MTLKCFYCGRPVVVKQLSDGRYYAKCEFPRCKLHPETDAHYDIEEVAIDWELIRRSIRGK